MALVVGYPLIRSLNKLSPENINTRFVDVNGSEKDRKYDEEEEVKQRYCTCR